MKVLVVGSGGREHAICDRFSRSPKVSKIYAANGNAGIANIAECVAIKPDEIDRLAEFARTNQIDLTFVGGETSLALGIVDEFEKLGLSIIGPTKAAARLEASKGFAKDFMQKYRVPTADYFNAVSAGDAIRELESGRFGPSDEPVVVKADGLAAGKGVVVAQNRAEAIEAITEMESLVGTAAADKIVIEECLFGREVSLLMFVNGENFSLMPATRDHKRIGEGDTGPNTGGMGTITDDSLLSSDDLANIVETIVKPTLAGCISEGFRFRGILFLGLMTTDTGPRLLEYNVRFGDPETQAILVRLETDLVDICETMLAGGNKAAERFASIKWSGGSSACVVLASRGYPQSPKTGDVVTGIERASQIAEVFHAGTVLGDDSELITAGGRVLGITASGITLDAALSKAYGAVAEVEFEGMQFRRDIGRT